MFRTNQLCYKVIEFTPAELFFFLIIEILEVNKTNQC